jgi:hypothetical protein
MILPSSVAPQLPSIPRTLFLDSFRVADNSAEAATRKHPQAHGANPPPVTRGHQVVGIVPPSMM